MRRITVLCIPADPEEPMTLKEIEQGNITQYRAIVGGMLEALELHEPPGTLWLHAEGKLNQFPPNVRATHVAQRHQAPMHIFDFIAGEAFISGPVDGDGVELSVGDGYRIELDVS